MEEILKKLEDVPTTPGVYLWKDINNRIIYIGKAINLKNRMLQYFKGAINSYKTKKLVSEIANFDFIICKNNKEALLLEKNLIERHNPEYNILLLDDRGYPYIKMKLDKKIELSYTKRINHHKSPNEIFYGPFPNTYGASAIFKLLQREIFFDKGLPIKNVEPEYWTKAWEKVKSILSFNNNSYINSLKDKMLEAADNLQFELALDIKKTLEFLQKMKEQQIVELKNSKNLDAFVFKVIDNTVHILFSFYRWGILINQDYHVIDIHIDLENTILDFLNLYYKNKIIPDIILVPNEFKNMDIELSANLKIFKPQIGNNKKIIDSTFENLLAHIQKNDYKNKIDTNLEVLQEIQQFYKLPKMNKIVIFDNSHLGNSDSVGVAITYLNGNKAKHLYKKFNHNLNFEHRKADVEYMKDSIERFFNHEENLDYDLIIVDGGIAQVHETKNILKSKNIDIGVIGLVKDDNHRTKRIIDLQEKIHTIKNKKWLNFLAQIQIEVDRFAKSHFRNKHKISSLEGSLTKIKGIGLKIEKKLLDHFKTYSSIYNATEQELKPFVSEKIIQEIKKMNKK
ncbi:GIY-YIG nuclease family protein [Mycoplasmopsis hyopharyngis]|uniref:GIY-YIG nuclease family protein n=1 Tax=Mycoplasmopsis hyopharyngis TaxID=29558 RepID=UPI0038733941